MATDRQTSTSPPAAASTTAAPASSERGERGLPLAAPLFGAELCISKEEELEEDGEKGKKGER
jgi:hypothetical protein